MKIGLERTDNNMDLTTWPQVNMINQKNYYTWVSSTNPGGFNFASQPGSVYLCRWGSGNEIMIEQS